VGTCRIASASVVEVSQGALGGLTVERCPEIESKEGVAAFEMSR